MDIIIYAIISGRNNSILAIQIGNLGPLFHIIGATDFIPNMYFTDATAYINRDGTTTIDDKVVVNNKNNNPANGKTYITVFSKNILPETCFDYDSGEMDILPYDHFDADYSIGYDLDGGTAGYLPPIYHVSDLPVTIGNPSKDGVDFEVKDNSNNNNAENNDSNIVNTCDNNIYFVLILLFAIVTCIRNILKIKKII